MNHKILSIILPLCFSGIAKAATPLQTFDAGEYTVMKVRTADAGKKDIIVGTSYEGVVLAMDYAGNMLWETPTGKGTMNHDLWCADITGDGIDEVFAANANGHLYCYDIDGEKLWDFKPFDSVHLTPMYAVTVVKDADKTAYVVCGDFTNQIYYLTNKGDLVKTIHSKSYSDLVVWGNAFDKLSEKGDSYANFLRTIPREEGGDLLVLHASNNHMQQKGKIYLFEPLNEKPMLSVENLKVKSEIGDLKVVDPDKDGVYEIVYGTSSLSDGAYGRVSFNDGTYKTATVESGYLERKYAGDPAYRVTQFLPVASANSEFDYVVLSSDHLYMVDNKHLVKSQSALKKAKAKGETAPKIKGKGNAKTKQMSMAGLPYNSVYHNKYTFNDAIVDKSGNMILASSQDGGSCIYVFDTKEAGWQKSYESLVPQGKIAAILDEESSVRAQLAKFKKPSWQRDPVKVLDLDAFGLSSVAHLNNKASLEIYERTAFGGGLQTPEWRSKIYANSKYFNTRDRRFKYTASAEDIIAFFTKQFDNAPGLAMWGGHGNDPLFYELSTLIAIADAGAKQGKPTIFIYPEMNDHDEDFIFLLENHIFPLADHLKKIGGKIGLRSKNVYFQGPFHTEAWKRVVDGGYTDVFIPMMEETTDKTQDMSVAGRSGLWAAGAVDGWAVRCSRDDPSFDRSRQFSSQKLANHFLRKTIFSLAYGAKYVHDYYLDKNHQTLALELLDKEALYVPKPEEILSYSPVHLSIYEPQKRYIEEAENNKWNTFFNLEEENNNPSVFSHLNGSWMGGALTPWDYSTYASGVVDRRQNAIANYPHGMVLITPVQEGPLASKESIRGKLSDRLHPMYSEIMKEYITDGVDYISEDGKKRMGADSYYTQIAKDIEEGAKKLPITVKSKEGKQLGWVVAQMTPTRLRLTLVDGGWLNPNEQTAVVTFNNIEPVKVTDVLSKENISTNGNEMQIEVPCGMFRFIDIEIEDKPNSIFIAVK